MPTSSLTPDDLTFLFGAPPEEAIAYLERKGMRLSWDWHETLDAANARSFTAAKAARVDILQALKKELVGTLKNGGTEKQFIDNLTPTLQRLGWWGKQVIVDGQGNAEVAQMGSPRRLKTIFRTNLQSAYMAGRYKLMMESADSHPYWKYIAILDGRTRASHRALNGRVFKIEDGFTGVGYPPNGYNCRCRAVSMTASRVKREGITPTDTSGILETREVVAGIDKRTGEIRKANQTGFYVPGADGKKIWVGPDVGFNSSPAASHIMDDVLVKRATMLNSNKALEQVRSVILSPPRQQAWKSFVQNTMDYGRQQGQTMTVGVMQAKELEYAKAQGVKIDSPIISLADFLLKSPKAERHKLSGDSLSYDDWLTLPVSLAHAKIAAWDTKENHLVYLLNGDQDVNMILVVRFIRQGGIFLPDTAATYRQPKTLSEAYFVKGRYEKIR